MNERINAQSLTIAILVFFITFIVIILAGLAIKKWNLCDIIIGFDPKKDNRDEISKLAGNNFICMGVILIAGEIVYYLCRNIISIEYYAYFCLIVIFGMLINLYVHWYKLRKRDNK